MEEMEVASICSVVGGVSILISDDEPLKIIAIPEVR